MKDPHFHHRSGAFKPVDRLDHTDEPRFSNAGKVEFPNIKAGMAQTNATGGPPIRELDSRPVFGSASPLQNRLKQSKQTSIFNVPKAGHRRPEHHRAGQHSIATSRSPSYELPPGQVPSKLSDSPSLVEVARPAIFCQQDIPAAPRPLFSTAGGDRPVNAYRPVGSKVIDLTGGDATHGFNADAALGLDRYGSFDPTNYVDAAQATENIKALLEGAFGEDDEDKPRARLRKKKATEALTTAVTEKLNEFQLDKESPSQGLAESQNKLADEHGVVDEDEDDGTVEGLTIKLLPHQIDGVAWMIDKEIGTRKKNGILPKGGILADDMGLGKTIQALSLILSNRRPAAAAAKESSKASIPPDVAKGTLVVAPLALIKQWESEIKTKVESSLKLKVLVHHGPSRTKRHEDLRRYDIVITTYQTLTSEHGDSSPKDDGLKIGCFGVHWYRIMLDEAHSIKNRNAKMTKAACDLKAVYRWCLTGTPMQNNLDEIQSLIRFLRIKPYSEVGPWREQIAQPMKNGRGGIAMKRLQYFLKAFMKRRTKDVLKKEGGLNFGKGSLDEDGQAKNGGFKIVKRDVQTIFAEFDGLERESYDGLETRTGNNLNSLMDGSSGGYMGALVLLLRLRQTCNHPELVNARKDRDALGASSAQLEVPGTPRKASKATSAANGSDDVDNIADMFGALVVNTKTCDRCGSQLSTRELANGTGSCNACEGDIKKFLAASFHQDTKDSDKMQRAKSSKAEQAPRVNRNRRIIDSDDEDDSDEEDENDHDDHNDDNDEDADEATGEWIVDNHGTAPLRLGKAGGQEDEDAEGGGDSLGEEDSDTEDGSSEGSDLDDSEVEDLNSSDNAARELQGKLSRRLVPSAKIRRLMKILEDESDNHKFIVFSEFTSMLDMMEPFLRSAGFRFTRYDGSMKNDDREASLERLRTDAKTRILLCSLRCGSLGLNLTAASRVVIMEPFWNPFVEEQAIDRVHRLNQTRDVVVYRLTVAGTVEERILALQERKRELARAAIDGAGGATAGKLSMADILRLFKRDAEHGHDERGAPGVGGGGGALPPSLLSAGGASPRKGAMLGRAGAINTAAAAAAAVRRAPTSAAPTPSVRTKPAAKGAAAAVGYRAYTDQSFWQ